MTLPKAPWRILGVAALAMLALIGMAINETRARDAGVEAVFPMEAIDPRSLLSGHYVIVALQEVLPDGEACPTSVGRGQAGEATTTGGWVSLKPEGARTRVLAFADSRTALASLDGVAVQGQVYCNTQTDWRPAAPTTPNTADAQSREVLALRLDLGVNRFHINQSEAMRIEMLMRERGDARVSAILSLGQDGRVRLKGLIVDQERLMLSW